MSDTYDSIPYTSYVYAHTHPDTLSTLGRLFGLQPVSPSRSRVLELGCASGGNLLPMAELLPDSEFLGIDRSQVQIDRGRAQVGELGLDNITLEQGDILRIDPQAIGTFDYVICHGVFSWVPRPVQDRILALCSAVLRPRGLAIISYNVYPGWHMREMVRHMMLYHLRRFDAPRKQVEQARALLQFVAGAVEARGSDDAYTRLLRHECELLAKMPDAYIFHEHLERNNQPLYFHEFIERLQDLPLRYVCDTDLNLMVARDLGSEHRETLARVATDQVSMEQYLDFVRNRQFRTSVLCRHEARPQRRLMPERIESLHLTMAGSPKLPDDQPEAAPSLARGEVLGFRCLSGAEISSPQPLTKAALLTLCERWPATLPFPELVDLARARVKAAGMAVESTRESLAADIIECLLRKAVIARSEPVALAAEPPARPRLSAFSRLAAEREGWLASLHHHRIDLVAPRQRFAALLDGSRDRDALIEAVVDLALAGELEVRTREGETVSEGPALREASTAFVDEQLAWLLRLPALLA